jgi:hypothetical protein
MKGDIWGNESLPRSTASRFPVSIFAWGVVVLLVYALLVQFWSPAYPVVRSQNTWEMNHAAAEAVLDSPVTPETVIVGSSLTQRFPKDVLGPGVANMAMIGDGALTGLEVIDRAAIKPRLVLIESNELEKPVNDVLIGQVFLFPIRELRRYVKL